MSDLVAGCTCEGVCCALDGRCSWDLSRWIDTYVPVKVTVEVRVSRVAMQRRLKVLRRGICKLFFIDNKIDYSISYAKY